MPRHFYQSSHILKSLIYDPFAHFFCLHFSSIKRIVTIVARAHYISIKQWPSALKPSWNLTEVSCVIFIDQRKTTNESLVLCDWLESIRRRDAGAVRGTSEGRGGERGRRSWSLALLRFDIRTKLLLWRAMSIISWSYLTSDVSPAGRGYWITRCPCERFVSITDV